MKNADTQDSPAAQLMEAVESLSDEEVLFLVKQARTMIYNHSVDGLNQAAEQLEKSTNRTRTKLSKSEGEAGVVSLEQSATGTSYVLVIRNQRKLMDQREMMGIIKIAHSTSDPADAIPRMLRWLKRNRDDVILDNGLTGRDPAVLELFHLLRNRFTLTDE